MKQMNNVEYQAPLVSVIMPVYNHEKFVEQALSSVLSQTYRPIEFIIIDDGSRDESSAIIKSYLENHPVPGGIKVRYRSRENRGAHVTINEGLMEAAGDYLAILNSDDVYTVDRLERCVSEAVRQRARLVFSYVEPIDIVGAPLPKGHPWRQWYADVLLNELDVSPSISTLLLTYNVGISTGNFVFHRSLFKDIGPFKAYRYAHDVDFLLRVCLSDEPVIIREKLYKYRLHTSNTISENDDRIEEEYSKIVYEYFASTLKLPPPNPMAPSFDNWPYSLAAMPWPRHLRRAVDMLLEGNPSERLTPGPLSFPSRDEASLADARHVTLVAHELSHTGAPVLLKDVASALHKQGWLTSLVPLRTGPLAADFTAMGTAVYEPSPWIGKMISLGQRSMALSHNAQLPALGRRLAGWSGRAALGVAHRIKMRAYGKFARGTLLINSFASWPIALDILDRFDGPAFWYIHETFDPGLLMRSAAVHQRLSKAVASGRVKLLFGSDGTRRVWAAEGYDGLVRYWSGLSSATLTPGRAGASDRRTILSVQSIGARKGTRALIEAFAYGRREGLISTDIELKIVGCHPLSTSPLARDLIRRVHEPDLIGAVRLFRSLQPAELPAHYECADLYVQSSTMECLPLALLNAMAYALPIVTTDVDGCKEAIIDGETGLTVPPRQAEDMARAMASLLADPARAAQYGAAARRRFEDRFSLEITAPQLIATLLGEELELSMEQ